MTPPDDVSTRLAEIRERVEAAMEGPWRRSIWNHATGDETPCITAEGLTLFRTHESPARVFDKHDYEADAEFVAAARSDVPYLLSLVGYLREELCLRTCNCGPTDPNPEKHAGYCNYVEAIEEVSAALRDAAQEGADGE